MANEENLKPFVPGEDSRRNLEGRPRKWVSELKDKGYKLSEINDALQVLLQMNAEELNQVGISKDATIMEQIVSKALLNSRKRGSLYNLETLLTRVYGKPRETVDTNNNMIITGPIQVNIISSGIPLANSESEVDAK